MGKYLVTMAQPGNVEDDEQATGYKAPAQKSLDSILKADQEDESLKKYKDALLGGAAPGAAVCKCEIHVFEQY